MTTKTDRDNGSQQRRRIDDRDDGRIVTTIDDDNRDVGLIAMTIDEGSQQRRIATTKDRDDDGLRRQRIATTDCDDKGFIATATV